MNKITLLRSYIILVIVVKFTFLLLILYSFIIKNELRKNPNDKNYKISLEINDRIKHQIEFIFTILMACLMIFLFNPNIKQDPLIDHETRLLLYLFGFLLIITSDWSNFIHF
jgi:hypothetical protein